MIKLFFEIIKEYRFKNLLYWDLFFAIFIMAFLYIITIPFCRDQLITLLGPVIGASASLVAVQISTIALIISLIQKETLPKLTPDGPKERNLILALGGPFLIGTISWVIGILLLLIGFFLVLNEQIKMSKILISFGMGFIVYSFVMIPILIMFSISLLNIQAEYLKKKNK